MIQEPMIEKLLAMRLHGMADALKTQQQDATSGELSFLDRLGMLDDQQWNWRQNQALSRRLQTAKLCGNACVEEIDYRTARGRGQGCGLDFLGAAGPGIRVARPSAPAVQYR